MIRRYTGHRTDPAVAPTVLDADEYGNPRPGQTPTRYAWLGGKQRSDETVTGLTLMGIRLYDPTTGRFLSIDPVSGGSANAYDYCNADPINCYDLKGQWPHIFRKRNLHFVMRDGKRGFHWLNHQRRIEWDKYSGWHFNYGKRHLHWLRGVASFAGHAVGWAARANPIFWVPIFIPKYAYPRKKQWA